MSMTKMKLPLTIDATHEGLKKKEFSAVELVESYLEQIKKHNGEYNIFLTTTDEIALKKAKEIDDLVAGNPNVFEEFPLLGAVTSYKDIFMTEGVRTTASSKVLESYIPPYSATSVKKMEHAGTIMIGKTNNDAWAHGASGENSDFGATKNPWNKEFVPGGSSSGSAASLSANMSLISLGTDTGGSVRQPANFSYLVGLKPTYGAISRYGVISMASSLDTVGEFGRSVSDVGKMFDVLKGEDGFDAAVKNADFIQSKPKYKIGIAKEYFGTGLNKEVEKNIDEVKKVFQSLGIEFVEITLPHTKYAVPVYYIVQPAEVSSNLGRFDGIRYGNGRESFGQEAKRRIMLGTYVLSSGYYDAYYLKAQKVRSKLIDDFDAAFKEVDAILSPVSPTPPFKIGENSSDPLAMYLADVYTCAVNLAGIPSLAIPSGFTENKLPLGFQLIGPRFSEPLLFDLGKTYQKETEYKPEVAF